MLFCESPTDGCGKGRLFFPIFPFVEIGHEPTYNFKREGRWFVISVHDAGFG